MVAVEISAMSDTSLGARVVSTPETDGQSVTESVKDMENLDCILAAHKALKPTLTFGCL